MKKGLIMGLLGALLSLSSGKVTVQEIAPVPVVEAPQHNLFVGNITGGQEADLSLDNIVDYEHIPSGTRIIAEEISTPLAEVPTHNLSLGVRSPWIAKTLRASGTLDASYDFQTWAYTEFLEARFNLPLPPQTEVLLRSGTFQNSNELTGGFLGTRLTHPNFTIDGDIYFSGRGIEAIGFVAGIIPTSAGDLYLSLGGRTDEKSLHIVGGWIHPEHFGLYSRTDLDLPNKVQTGKIMIATNGMTMTRSSFDFRAHINNGTELERVTTGTILDSWAPFDSFMVGGDKDNFVVIVDWINSPETSGGSAELLYRPIPGLFFGLGAGEQYQRKKGEHQPNLVGELYAVIPGTPLEAWLKLDYQLRTGTVNPTGYIGLVKSF